MASRRVRIKGIANIPQRRKTGNATNEHESEEQKASDTGKSEEIIDKPNLNFTSDSLTSTSDVIDRNVMYDETISNIDSETKIIDTKGQVSDNLKNNGTDSDGIEIVTLDKRHELFSQDNEDVKVNSEVIDNINLNNTKIEEENRTDKLPAVRRKFLKPPICVNVLKRKVKEKNEEIKAEPNKENVQESANLNLNEIEIASNDTNSTVLIQKNEAHVGPLVSKLGLVKDATKSGSDTEYQQPPTSPTKILNRRIKAVPKLHQRRTSFSIGSASESEDDTRKSYSRIRNDSVCSANSGVNECHSTNDGTISPTRKDFTVVPRKCRRTEQTRKFAEARREFNMKFSNGKPDKQKLTMIDLIFYNPATSPMSYNKRKRQNTTSSEVSDTKSIKGDKIDEEKVDDPEPATDSDNEIPAPQIKVGPNGEIIVDEKSLVIENTEIKKGRAALQMSEVVDGDEDTSYGVYKRIKRSKDWSKEETLRFYKALNTIGTDFTMMCELFPKRTRRELKMKFKKEERLNQSLINKAVMQPIEFDLTELRKELELEERKAAEGKKLAQEMKIVKMEHKKNSKKCEKIKGIDGNPEYFPTVDVEKEEPVKKRKKTPYEAIRRGINGILSDSDEDDDICESLTSINQKNEESDASETGSDVGKVSNILKPTRYGRIPKVRSQDTSNISAKPLKKRKKARSESSDGDKNQGSLEPGSIMIVKSKTPADQFVYKVYIVTDNQTKQQINLSPNVIENLTGMDIHKIENGSNVCDIQAHNILTISAQECPSDLEQITKNMQECNNVDNNQLDDNQLVNSIIDTIPQSLNNSRKIEISSDTILFPFDECLKPTIGNQNITVSHEDNKMIVVTENNQQCVLTT